MLAHESLLISNGACFLFLQFPILYLNNVIYSAIKGMFGLFSFSYNRLSFVLYSRVLYSKVQLALGSIYPLLIFFYILLITCDLCYLDLLCLRAREKLILCICFFFDLYVFFVATLHSSLFFIFFFFFIFYQSCLCVCVVPSELVVFLAYV